LQIGALGPLPTLARVEAGQLNFPKAAIQFDWQKYASNVSFSIAAYVKGWVIMSCYFLFAF
jgi:hypothetical protein